MPKTVDLQKKTLLLVSCVVGLLLTLHFFRPPAGGLWTQVFFDSLHVPVFGLVAILIYLMGDASSNWLRRAAISVAVASALGVLSEAAQIFTSRDASLRDLVADCVGAAGFLAIFLAIRPSLAFSIAQRFLLLGSAVLLLSWVLAPIAVTSAAYVERYSQYPAIVRFDSHFGRVLTRAQNIDYEIIAPEKLEAAHALVTLRDKPWPGVAFHDVWPDWSRYKTLVIELGVNEESPLQINVRAHDESHKSSNAFSDRFNRSYTLDPGRHVLRIPLTDLANAPRGRSMDLSRMSELILFSDASNAGRSFRIYEIRLE